MDGYADELIARGPTLTPDGESTTGSLHIVDLPDLEAVQTFAYDEPYYSGGVFEDVLITRFRKHTGGHDVGLRQRGRRLQRYLVHTKDDAPRPLNSTHLIMYGDLAASTPTPPGPSGPGRSTGRCGCRRTHGGRRDRGSPLGLRRPALALSPLATEQVGYLLGDSAATVG